MAAAENGALPRGKVGGVADVVRDLPPALAEAGWTTTVLTPEYGLFADIDGATCIEEIAVAFAGDDLSVRVYELPSTADNVRHIAFAHERFAPQGPGIYCDDGSARPFASDAGKFALFSAAAATWVRDLETPPDVVHLHDWHAALYCLLRESDPAFAALQNIHTVYTIHNLALQGIRPLADDESSLAAWYPHLDYRLADVVDPRFGDTVNPMATAIRLADAVNTVSPTYANEILLSNDPARGFRGGEGLEDVLSEVASAGNLVGILNGCEYPQMDRRRPGWRRLLDTIGKEVYEWIVAHRGPRAAHEASLEKLRALPGRRPKHLLTSIGRLTEQKAALFLERTSEGATAIEKILGSHADDTVLIVLGSGDPHYEGEFHEIARHHRNFLFLNGYSETFSDLLYRAGDLFLMPSSFEPCGISQMLAMRASQPCVVHAVGGLKDTVIHDVNGFTFSGDSPVAQAEGFVDAVDRAIAMRNLDPERWLRIRSRAQGERFSWALAAERYSESLYLAA